MKYLLSLASALLIVVCEFLVVVGRSPARPRCFQFSAFSFTSRSVSRSQRIPAWSTQRSSSTRTAFDRGHGDAVETAVIFTRIT